MSKQKYTVVLDRDPDIYVDRTTTAERIYVALVRAETMTLAAKAAKSEACCSDNEEELDLGESGGFSRRPNRDDYEVLFVAPGHLGGIRFGLELGGR